MSPKTDLRQGDWGNKQKPAKETRKEASHRRKTRRVCGVLDTKRRKYFKEMERLTVLNVTERTSKMGWRIVHKM